MIFYVSGNYAGDFAFMDWLITNKSAILTSFAYPRILEERIRVGAPMLRERGQKMLHMLDSGAFTAWSSGKVINLSSYCDTCKRLLEEYSDCYDWVFVSLDVIAGERGRTPSEEELNAAAKQMITNYDYLRKNVHGIVKPVFHTGDPAWLLNAYADAEYIGIGMSQNFTERERVAFASWAGRSIKAKLHGLAATGYEMLRAVAWHSVDSAAWQYAASMGGINWMLPNGQLISIAASKESPRNKEFGAHVSTLPPAIIEAIEVKAVERGTDLNKLATIYQERWKWNVLEYEAACKKAIPRLDFQEGLFDA